MLRHKTPAMILLALIALVLSACGPQATPNLAPVGLANPAAVYCQNLGYKSEIVDTDAGQAGVCMFTDGSKCDEWEFLRGQCGTQFSYCAQQGYKMTSVETDQEIVGTCVFPDGTSCPELDFFRGTCKPGNK
jgi:putative hemolysin